MPQPILIPASLAANQRPGPPQYRVNYYPFFSSLNNCSFCIQIELHVHLDGVARHSTLYELCKAKSLALPGNGSLEDFKREGSVQRPKDLMNFLGCFAHFTGAFM